MSRLGSERPRWQAGWVAFPAGTPSEPRFPAWGRGLLHLWSPVSSGGKKLRCPQSLLLLSPGCRMLMA